MTDKEIIIDGKLIKCPCYLDNPLHRYHKACLIQSQAFSQQQTEEKPILRCDEIKNCPIKENYKQLQHKEQECENLKKGLESKKYHWEKATEEILKGTQQFVDRMNEAESEVLRLKKQVHCYSCGTCKGREDYNNVKRHCENAINSLHKEQKRLDCYNQAVDEIRNSIIEPHCKTCKEQAIINSDCDECIFGEIIECINELHFAEDENGN